MEAGDTFILNEYLHNKAVRMNGECFYKSGQVMRFKISWSKYQMEIEKRLMTKTQPWKLISANFDFTKSDSGRSFLILCKAIEDEINPKKKFSFMDLPKNSR